MKEQPASVINTRQTFYHISVLDPGRGKIAGRSAGPGRCSHSRGISSGHSAKNPCPTGKARRTAGPEGQSGPDWVRKKAIASRRNAETETLRVADGSLPFKTQK